MRRFFKLCAGCIAIASVSLLFSSHASAQVIAYDSFAYTPGVLLTGQNGGFGWASAWKEHGYSSTSSVVSANSVTFGSLTTAGNSFQSTSDGPIGNDRDLAQPYGTTGTTIFFSAVIRPLDPMNAGLSGITYFQYGIGSVAIGKGGGNANYGIENQGGGGFADSGVKAQQNVTVFLVARITFLDGNDIVDLFVNPTPGAPLPATPNARKTDRDIGVSTLAGFGCSIRVNFDELRIGYTYADVAPTTVTMPPASVQGTLTLQGANDPEQNITFVFRPKSGGTPFTRKQVLLATGSNTGTFNLTNIPYGTYDVAIKGVCWLQKTMTNVVFSAASPTVMLNATLFTGDLNNDNHADIGDFGLLVNNFGQDGDP